MPFFQISLKNSTSALFPTTFLEKAVYIYSIHVLCKMTWIKHFLQSSNENILKCLTLLFETFIRQDSIPSIVYFDKTWKVQCKQCQICLWILGFSAMLIKIWRLSAFLADLLGNRSVPQRVQKVMVCDLRLLDFAFQGCALAEPGGPWRLTFALGRLENLRFFIQIICWTP